MGFFQQIWAVQRVITAGGRMFAVVKPLINLKMNKEELIEAIASGSKLTKADSGRALDATIEAIEKALKKGDRVGLVGFGSFSVAKRAARMGRNPQTGKAIKIAAKKVVKFKAGTVLATAVNKGK
jgi:DNA-binding protein HU-beta